MKSLLALIAAAVFVATPLALAPETAHAKTEKQLRDEAKAKEAKQKAAAKKAEKEAKKASKK